MNLARTLLILLILVLSSGLLSMPARCEAEIIKRYGPAWRTDKNGWVHLHIEGEPGARGFQYGYLMAPELKTAIADIKHVTYLETGKKWEFFIGATEKLFARRIPPEYMTEIKGITDGARKAGLETTWQEILALNAYEEIFDYWWPGAKAQYKYQPSPEALDDHCSAFIATGAATRDGGIIIAHNDWSSYVIGQSYNILLDVAPSEGQRIFMQTKPGHLDSNTDFFITGAGIVGTETTIAGFNSYTEAGLPSFIRCRKAMQYSETLDDVMRFLKEGNNGVNASIWLLGNINTGEIVRFEQGLRFDSVTRTDNGFFIGFNAPVDPRIRNLECSHTGYQDIRRHTGARRVRLTQLMREYYGKLDLEAAKTILADHYDVYLKKPDNPCSRTVDGHYDLDNRAYMSDLSRPKPYAPHGTLDGKVSDSKLAASMSLWARWGNSSGMPFDAEAFLKEHIQYEDLRGHLRDRPARPWTFFTGGEL
jgi:hypothetical protein